jgi:hypothetical protein
MLKTGGYLSVFQRTYFPHPLSAAGEERVDQRSAVGVSQPRRVVFVGILQMLPYMSSRPTGGNFTNHVFESSKILALPYSQNMGIYGYFSKTSSVFVLHLLSYAIYEKCRGFAKIRAINTVLIVVR